MKDLVSQLQVTVVPSAVVDIVWKDTKKFLQAALDTTSGRYGIEDIYALLQSGELVLWLVLDDEEPIACITTRITNYPSGSRAMAMDWIGGKRMAEWLPMAHSIMKRYASDNGCTYMEGYGRKGWGRWLQKYGWKPEYITYRMDLNDG
jgi:hypothetical protein